MITFHKQKPEDVLFFIAYGIFLTFGILSSSFYYKYFINIYSVIKYSCVAALIVREVIIHKYTLRSFLVGVVFVTLIFITRTQSTVATVTYILIFVFCARNIDFDDIARFSMWISIIVGSFIVASSFLGIIDNYISYNANRVRQYLGFRYSLFGQSYLFNITLLAVYLGKKDIKWGSLLLLTVVNCWMFAMTNSRLSFGLSIMIIIVAAFLKLDSDFFVRRKLVCYFMMFSFIICGFISYYFTAIYDANEPWQYQLNQILGGRLALGKLSLGSSGVTLFGQKMNMVGNGLDAYGRQSVNQYNYVDSFYVQVLQRYGIIFTMIWIGLLTYTLYCCYKRGDYIIMLCLTFVAVHCILDDASMSLNYNTFWFAISGTMISANQAYHKVRIRIRGKTDTQMQASG